MQETGRFCVFFDSEEQAKTASLIIRDLCENRSSDPDGKFVKEWLDHMAPTEDGRGLIIKDDAYIPMMTYEGLVLGLCMEIAKQHPDFGFEVWASGGDDEGIQSFSEHGTSRNYVTGYEFSYHCEKECVDEPDYDSMDWEDFDYDLAETRTLCTTVEGRMVDGAVQFTIEEHEIDNDDEEAYDDEEDDDDEDFEDEEDDEKY